MSVPWSGRLDRVEQSTARMVRTTTIGYSHRNWISPAGASISTFRQQDIRVIYLRGIVASFQIGSQGDQAPRNGLYVTCNMHL